MHFLQIWIIPDTGGLPPAYGQQAFDREGAKRSFVLLASKDGREGSLQVHQDADVWVALLGEGDRRELPIRSGRGAWVHVARGTVTVNGNGLHEGDGAAVTREERLRFAGDGSSEILVFDLN